MRRLVLEFDVNKVAELKQGPKLDNIESMETITFLRSTPEEVALIFRIKLKDPTMKLDEALGGDFDELQVLEKSGDRFICYFRKRRFVIDKGKDLLGSGVYLSPPYEIRDGRLRATFLANAKEIRTILAGLSEGGMPYRIISLMDAKFLPDSPLSQLTERQRRVIVSAFKLGYYDVPRRVSSEELARQLDIKEPTLVMHRRKAERRLLSSVLGQI